MKFMLKGIISPPPSVKFQNADYAFGLLHINYQSEYDSWGIVSVFRDIAKCEARRS